MGYTKMFWNADNALTTMYESLATDAGEAPQPSDEEPQQQQQHEQPEPCMWGDKARDTIRSAQAQCSLLVEVAGHDLQTELLAELRRGLERAQQELQNYISTANEEEELLCELLTVNDLIDVIIAERHVPQIEAQVERDASTETNREEPPTAPPGEQPTAEERELAAMLEGAQGGMPALRRAGSFSLEHYRQPTS